MSSTPRRVPTYQIVDGFRIPGYMSAESHRSALAYSPRPDDLIVVTYPKCGTNWMLNIVSCIFNEGEQCQNAVEYLNHKILFLQKYGAAAAEIMRRPGAIAVHLPFHLVPYNQQTKYIFVARNPKDCCVSFYHHTQSIPGYNFSDGNFDDFFELFIRGEVDFGDYFDALLSWYNHRNDPNVFFVTYEQLKENLDEHVLKIAEFMGSEYGDQMRKNPYMLEKVVRNSSFDHMQKTMDELLSELYKLPPEQILDNPSVAESIKKMFKARDSIFSPNATSAAFVRKGVVGDWRNYFSADQNKRMETKFLERTKGTDIPELWEDIM